LPKAIAVAFDSSNWTAGSVLDALLSQVSETSSSVGPTPVGLSGDSE
jgi:hypothetical protein